MRDQLIVHVGLHKTGSSSIQESLAANLVDRRFRYLQFGMPNGSLAVQSAYGRLNAFRPNAPANDTHYRRLRARRKGMTLITQALNNLGAETGIISAEGISALPKTGLVFFFDLLRRYRENVVVVAYLRRPKGHTESAYQQKLKAFFVPLSGAKQVIRYRTIFENFDNILGRDRVSLWAFDSGTLHRGCVVQDLCQRCGIQFQPAGVIRANEGLSVPATQLLYIYRKQHPRFRKCDHQIVQALSGLTGPKLRLHSTLLAKIIQVDNDQIAWTSERVGIDMSEDYTRDDDWAIRGEDDMMALSAETVDWLAARCGLAAASLSRDMPAVAEAVASLGIPVKGPSASPPATVIAESFVSSSKRYARKLFG